MLSVIDLSLAFFNTFCGAYSIPKESKYTAVFLSINSKIQFVPLLFCMKVYHISIHHLF